MFRRREIVSKVVVSVAHLINRRDKIYIIYEVAYIYITYNLYLSHRSSRECFRHTTTQQCVNNNNNINTVQIVRGRVNRPNLVEKQI